MPALICPICGEGKLQSCVVKSAVEYKKQSTTLNMKYSVCDACGSEQADADQLRANKRSIEECKVIAGYF